MGFLTGKTAIITGAGRAVLSDGRCGSIGYGIATAYAKEGANLVITGRADCAVCHLSDFLIVRDHNGGLVELTANRLHQQNNIHTCF